MSITVEDNLGNKVPGALVTGVWSRWPAYSYNCVTNLDGVCSVESGNIKKRYKSVGFVVSYVSLDAIGICA